MKKYIAIILTIIVLITIGVVANNNRKNNTNEDGKFKIVTSFYPMYIMTLNIVQGADDVELTNMTDINVGCIHDYTLTTDNMKKLENADVLIENGLGLESFIDNINANRNINIIDSSENITDLIEENPHIWTSISNYIKQVENVKNALSKLDEKNAKLYDENSKSYIQKLEELQQRYNKELNLNGKGAVILNEAFTYLGRDLGLNLKEIHTSHEESTISAEVLKDTIEQVKQNGTDIIIVDINDDLKNAETLQNETGAKIYKLDSALTGGLTSDAYINSMTSNLDILKNNK